MFYKKLIHFAPSEQVGSGYNGSVLGSGSSRVRISVVTEYLYDVPQSIYGDGEIRVSK
jgi:hypothetical protein